MAHVFMYIYVRMNNGFSVAHSFPWVVTDTSFNELFFYEI